MCTSDDYVSPYLRRPLRSYDEYLREQAERGRGEIRPEATNCTAAQGPGQGGNGDGEPRR